MEKKINLEEIITKHCYICKDDSMDVHSSILDVSILLMDFGKQLLELASKNAYIEYNMMNDSAIINKPSILNTINQVE